MTQAKSIIPELVRTHSRITDLMAGCLPERVNETLEQTQLSGEFNTDIFRAIVEAHSFQRTHGLAHRDDALQAREAQLQAGQQELYLRTWILRLKPDFEIPVPRRGSRMRSVLMFPTLRRCS